MSKKVTKLPPYTRDMHEKKRKEKSDEDHKKAKKNITIGSKGRMIRKRLPDSWGDRAWEDGT